MTDKECESCSGKGVRKISGGWYLHPDDHIIGGTYPPIEWKVVYEKHPYECTLPEPPKGSE